MLQYAIECNAETGATFISAKNSPLTALKRDFHITN
jgi:hypothetical protein